MSFLTSLYFIVSLSCLFPGIYILSKDRKNKVNILYFLYSLSLFFFIFFGGLIQLLQNRNEITLFFKLFLISGILFMSFNIHFTFEFTKIKINRFLKYLPYIISFFIIFLILTSRTFEANLVIQNNYKYENATHEILFMIVFPYGLSCGLTSIILLFRFSAKTNSKREKKQIRILILSIILTLLATNLYQILNSLIFDSFAVIFFIFYVYGSLYALVKYQLLSFRISDLTKEIISNIQDIVLILNQERIITEANNNLGNINSNELINKKFDEFIVKDDNLAGKFNELASGKINSFNSRIIYNLSSENMITDSYMSKLIDKFGDFVGILVISKENKGIKQFKKIYGLTSRQFEIIELSIEGFSNPKIAEKLGIKKKTIEMHLFNIYNKLSVNNKIELFNIASDYNLIKKNLIKNPSL